MKHACPYCDWPEFTVFRNVEQASRGLFGLRFRRTGKIAVCARCTEQYVIGEAGAYKIAPGREAPRPVSAEPPKAGQPAAMVDEDQAKLW